jgi:hypothetical protein
MTKLSKWHSITLFCGALLAFPILVQAAAPPLRLCAGVILIEEDEMPETPPAPVTPMNEERQF